MPSCMQRLAIARGRRILHDEAALRSDRHDHRVLHHLRLHQAEHFGAEVLAPVRPAQPAARDASAAQMHAFHPRRVDPDLEHRLRLGQARHLRRIELERQVRLRLSVAAPVEMIGAHRRVDHAEELPQDAVFVEIRHLVERGFDFREHALGALVAHLAIFLCRIEAHEEQFEKLARDRRIAGERAFDIRIAEGRSDLPQILRIRAQIVTSRAPAARAGRAG